MADWGAYSLVCGTGGEHKLVEGVESQAIHLSAVCFNRVDDPCMSENSFCIGRSMVRLPACLQCQEAWQSERTVRPRVPEDEGLVVSDRAKQVDVLPMPRDVLQRIRLSLNHVS